MPAEGDDLDRQRPVAAELIGKLGLIHHDDQARAGLGDDFLAQQGAAAAFDHIEIGIDFVSAIDGEVNARMMLERGERDAERARVSFGSGARWGWR